MYCDHVQKKRDDEEKERIVRMTTEMEQMNAAQEEAEFVIDYNNVCHAQLRQRNEARKYYEDLHKQAELQSREITQEEAKYAREQEEACNNIIIIIVQMWQKREAVWNKDKEAREKLRRQVQAERDVQLKIHDQVRAQEKQSRSVPVNMEQSTILGALYKKDESEIKRKHQQEQRQMLETQIKEKENAKEQEKRRIEADNKSRADAYAAEQRKIDAELQKTMANYQPGKAKRTFH